MLEKNLLIEGMHCEGCEARICNVLKTIDGICKVSADHKTGSVQISAAKEIDQNIINKKIEALDFKVVGEK